MKNSRVEEENKIVWYLNGLKHREDGPAVDYANGTKQWWLNGKQHREDGPAVDYANGNKGWYVNGEFYRPERKTRSFRAGM